MSLSYHILFLRDRNDPDHQKKVAVLKACQAADVALPDEINEYFGEQYDEDYPLETRIPLALHKVSSGLDWYEVKVDDIPKGVKVIKFCISY